MVAFVSLVVSMPHSVLGSTVRGHAIRDTVRDYELDPVYGVHIATQEDAVAIIDQG